MFATTQRLSKKPQKAKKRKTPQRTTIGKICKISPMLLALNAEASMLMLRMRNTNADENCWWCDCQC